MRGTLLTFSLLFISNLLFGQFGKQQIISTDGDGALKAIPVDINGDGNIDIVSSSGIDDKIVWFENLDGFGTFSSEIIIEQDSFYYLFDVIDIDSDGDMDIIMGESGTSFRLYHKKNIDGNGSFASPELFLDNITDPILSIEFADIDNDNDLDIIAGFYQTFGNRIVSFENLDGQGNFSEETLLVYDEIYYVPLVIEDIDQDGFVDILTAIDEYEPATFIWFKNLGEGNFGTEQEIFQFDFFQSDLTSVIFMKYEDINADGKKDIIANCINEDTVGFFNVWLENIDNDGNFYDPDDLEVVDAYDKYYDLDNDGDNDVLRSRYFENEIIWIENINGSGNFGNFRTVTTEVVDVRSSVASDLNNDGLLDVISASYDDDKVAWYPNSGILGFSENSIPPISIFPNPVKGKIFINSEERIEKVTIYNALGMEVIQVSNSMEINVENLPQGIYLVKILFEDGTVASEKMIKH